MKLPEFVAGPAQQLKSVDPNQAGAMGKALVDVGGAMMQVGEQQQRYQQRLKLERTAHEAALNKAYVEGEMGRWEQDFGGEYLSGPEVDALLGDNSGVQTTEAVSTDSGEVVQVPRMVPKREYYAAAWEKKYRSVIEVAAGKYTDPVMKERFVAAAYADLESKKAELFRQGEEEERDERKRTEVALIDSLYEQRRWDEGYEIAASSPYVTEGELAALAYKRDAGLEMEPWRETLLSGTPEEKAALARELRAKGADWLNKPEHVNAIANQLEADVAAASGSAADTTERDQKRFTSSMQKQLGLEIDGLTGPEREQKVDQVYRDLIADPNAVAMMTAEGFKWLQEWYKTGGFADSNNDAIGQLEGMRPADIARMPDDRFDAYLMMLNTEDRNKWEQKRAEYQTQSTGQLAKAEGINSARDLAFKSVYGDLSTIDDGGRKDYFANQRAFNAMLDKELQLARDRAGGDLTMDEVTAVLDSIVIAKKLEGPGRLWGTRTETPDLSEINLSEASRKLKEYNRRLPPGVQPIRPTNTNIWLIDKAAEMDGDLYQNYNNLRRQWQAATN